MPKSSRVSDADLTGQKFAQTDFKDDVQDYKVGIVNFDVSILKSCLRYWPFDANMNAATGRGSHRLEAGVHLQPHVALEGATSKFA